ncbi:MAG: DUF4919 domain-containing protein [Taibaiella sp.]|nr:DUF4919 domain-containing protein [Taibaiella sp.]
MKSVIFYLLLIGAIIYSLTGYSQERELLKPDYISIQQIINDPNSAFYYPQLFKRYQTNDTTLSPREYRMLYFGYFFQDKYSAIPRNVQEDSLKILLAKDELEPAEWQSVIRMDKKALVTRPFDLKKLNLLYVGYKMSGDSTNVRLYSDKIRKIAFAILSSGDGQSEETALHVLQVSDEYALINMLGYEYSGHQQLTGAECDYLTLKDNTDNVKGLYFDVKQIFNSYKRILDGSMSIK